MSGQIRTRVVSNLVLARKTARYKQTDIAAFLGVTTKSISDWECGRTDPGYETLEKLGEFYSLVGGGLWFFRDHLGAQEQPGNRWILNTPHPEMSAAASSGEQPAQTDWEMGLPGLRHILSGLLCCTPADLFSVPTEARLAQIKADYLEQQADLAKTLAQKLNPS